MTDKKAYALYLHALTPVHAGTGQVSASVIDLPIAREKATHWPVIPATSLKGVLKAKAEAEKRLSPEQVRKLYGWEGERGKDNGNAGDLQFGDARLLCFPVRSWRGVFAYATCPLALTRLRRDFKALGVPVPFDKDAAIPNPPEEGVVHGSPTVLADGGSVWLDDLKLDARPDAAVESLAKGIAEAVFADETEAKSFVERFVILSNNVFDFLAENATEVAAHVAMEEETKKVKKGALWYEEAVPAEAIFAAPVLGPETPANSGTVHQIGGHESVGRGFCRVMVTPR